MARSKAGLSRPEFTAKNEVDDVPVAPCQGWVDSCEFCDKRFGNWVESSDEILEKIPTKPGIFMVALKSKSIVEVVDIVLNTQDIQKPAYSSIDNVKTRVADKRSKSTKATILCRHMTFKQANDKDVINLCAHWYNNGVLPKFMEAWQGLDILQKTDSLVLSEKFQKWCYPKKDAFWKKPKSLPTKLVEVVEACDWNQPCEICDNNFGEWKDLGDVVNDSLVPDVSGIYMLSVCYGKTREVVNICFDKEAIKMNLEKGLKDSLRYSNNHILKNKKFVNRNATVQVRWMEVKNSDTDNCCFLYAHWVNVGVLPIMNFQLPGERLLEKNKYFVLRNNDKKWCYEIDVFKQNKITKIKNKKHILNDLEGDFNNLNFGEQA